MSEFYQQDYGISQEGYRKFYIATYFKMGIGLLITALVSFLGYLSLVNGGIVYNMLMGFSGFGYILLMLVQVGVCFFFGVRLEKMSSLAAQICFFLYCVITGITFSVLPLIFEISTIFMAFVFCAILFVNLVIIGMTTKIDISKFSGIMVAGLITLVVCSIFSIFVHNEIFNNIYNYLGIIIFMGFTAWDAQKLKRFYACGSGDTRISNNYSSYAAFQLYLDFINLFIRILEIFGNRRDNN